jgi:hypothetical protein
MKSKAQSRTKPVNHKASFLKPTLEFMDFKDVHSHLTNLCLETQWILQNGYKVQTKYEESLDLVS